MSEPIQIQVDYPLKYSRLNPQFRGFQFRITDNSGKILAYTADEAAAKLLVNFTNGFFKFVGAEDA